MTPGPIYSFDQSTVEQLTVDCTVDWVNGDPLANMSASSTLLCTQSWVPVAICYFNFELIVIPEYCLNFEKS